jgi:rod shape determining protein RodA
MLQSLRVKDLPWPLLLTTLALTAAGVACVISACYDSASPLGLGHEPRQQLLWWLVGALACGVVMRIPLASLQAAAVPAYLGTLAVQLAMIALAGTPLVPNIKGLHNWIRLGPLGNLQPSELLKLGTLMGLARLLASPGFDVRRLGHVLLALATAGVPSLILAKSFDLGSAMTFPPMAFGMLWAAGMRLGHALLLVAAGAALVVGGVQLLPKEGAKAYQYQRIQAFLHPDDYRMGEGYQTSHSIEAIGSGQVLGKGYLGGDLTRIKYVPENHTDMIFSVVGEETGLVGGLVVFALFQGFITALVGAATGVRAPFGRLLIAGFAALIMGEATINLAVAMGLLPVTGITLPFFSYGGSSLLGCYLGVGLACAAAVSEKARTTAIARRSRATTVSGWEEPERRRT